ncbi:MAG: phosphoenolpyruvate-protein phosphotransferase [Gammaproteobacteria bacterium]|nr:MAG: phosphoenolpyruvate-protein phosphotransferase [Gammaproteobacteria bacterium]
MTTPAIHIIGMPYVPGSARGSLQRGLQDNPEGKIVVLEQPPPGPFESPPSGFVMVDGAPLSHSMIPLLGSGVPGILITRSQARGLQSGMELVLDGATGLLTSDLSVHISPRELPVAGAVACTPDGEGVSLRVSARSQQAVQCAVESGAEAIGLLRSEFLAPEDGQLPDMAFYHSAFRKLCETAAGLPLTIRLFDIAAGKCPSWLPLPPAGVLGRQGVRLYADEPVHGIYRAQLQAIAALAPEFEVRILLPYVADLAELQYWHDDIKRQLACPFAIGAMAETPAAALQLREWLEVVEFVAIGCNDLMQCLFGADRDQPELHRYLDPYAPALYRFLRQVAHAAGDRLDAIQLCGVLPQLPEILPLLLGLGYRVFSVEATLVPYLWATIARTHAGEARALAEQVCRAHSSTAVRELVGQTGHRYP